MTSENGFRIPRRTRTLSFTPTERKFIQDSVMANREILLGNKALDGPTADQRSKVWDTITMQFNMQPGFYKRDKKQLRKLWGNIRANQRQAAWYSMQGLTGGDLDSDQSQDSIIPTPCLVESGVGEMDRENVAVNEVEIMGVNGVNRMGVGVYGAEEMGVNGVDKIDVGVNGVDRMGVGVNGVERMGVQGFKRREMGMNGSNGVNGIGLNGECKMSLNGVERMSVNGFHGGDGMGVNGYERSEVEEVETKPSVEMLREMSWAQCSSPGLNSSNDQVYHEDQSYIKHLIIEEYKAKVKLALLKTKEQEEHLEFMRKKRRKEMEILDEELKLKKLNVLERKGKENT